MPRDGRIVGACLHAMAHARDVKSAACIQSAFACKHAPTTVQRYNGTTVQRYFFMSRDGRSGFLLQANPKYLHPCKQ